MTDINNSLSENKSQANNTVSERESLRTLRREKISAAIRYCILIIVGLLMLYPLLWMFSAAFKPNSEIFGRDADLVVVVDCQIPADDLVVHLFRL